MSTQKHKSPTRQNIFKAF